MSFVRPDQISTVLFTALCIAIIFALIRSAYIAQKKWIGITVLVIAWLGLFCNAVRLGLISPSLPQNVFMAMISSNLVGLMIGLSPLGRKISRKISVKSLIAFQVFRLPLEIILHAWVQQGSIPETMTWTGNNFDIVSGVLALFACFFVTRFWWMAWTFNIVGIVLLINVVRVAVLSTPGPLSWNVTPPLQLLFHLPYALIVPVCVAGALAGHVILTRALVRKKLQPVARITMKRFLEDNGLTLMLLVMFVASFVGQLLTGFHSYNEDLVLKHLPTVLLSEYWKTGHFIGSVGENWESEFFQMAIFVWFTAVLYQRGSAESKIPPDQRTAAEEKSSSADERYSKQRRKKYPILWRLYEHSLTLALVILFFLSFMLHAFGSWHHINEENAYYSQPIIGFWDVFKEQQFWFESFQNWQSEFLSIAVMGVLSIYLRQINSPQSKPLRASHEETGSES